MFFWMVHNRGHDLVMALLRSRNHATTLTGAVVDWDFLTGRVSHKLTRRLLHIPGGAGCLIVVSTLLLALFSLLALSDQGVVAVDQRVVLGDLLVCDGAALLVVRVADLLRHGDELRGVGVVALLNFLVDAGQDGVFSEILQTRHLEA